MEACTLLQRLVWDHHVQNVLRCEGVGLEFHHIASYLFYYCQHHSQTQLMNLVNLVLVLVMEDTALVSLTLMGSIMFVREKSLASLHYGGDGCGHRQLRPV